ncbi:NAD(P)-binding protein [Daedalea quercina L-15889]|uniref:NAD(P)-binding protein n=1 Tax=Daedalea quercina L-15889 TaxID=1314783 RepID=A0A165N863_9APHY|nr:NAD(P)-binding protein [Daedalea quercina L-15889]
MAGKVVIVTGCTKGGIGFALCEEFAIQRCTVYATARRTEAMEGFKDPNISQLRLDVTSDEDVAEVVKTVLEREGNIDILVNNAGGPCSGPLAEIDLARAQKTFDTNVFSVLRLTQAVFPHMASKRSGTIVNIGSLASDTPSPWGGIYGATKAALIRLSEILYMEVAPFNIHVVHISPGGVRTNFGVTAISLLSLREDSFYKPWFDSMVELIDRTQGPESLTPEQFAQKVVRQIVKPNPPRYMTLGYGARVFAILQWFPRAFICWLMWRMVAGRVKAA